MNNDFLTTTANAWDNEHGSNDIAVDKALENGSGSGNAEGGVEVAGGQTHLVNASTPVNDHRNQSPVLELDGMQTATIPLMAALDEATQAAKAALAMNASARSSPSTTTVSNASPNEQSGTLTRRKRSSPGTTTARQNRGTAKKAKGSQRIAPGGRVKVTRKNLWPIVQDDNQKAVLKNYNDNYNFYGTVVSGGGNKGWKVEFSLFPASNKVVLLQRKRIHLVASGEEEVPYDKATDLEKYAEINKPKKPKAVSAMQQSDNSFRSLPVEDRKVISEFDMVYDKEGSSIKWKILQDGEYLKASDDPCRYPQGVHILHDIDFVEKGMSVTFFDEFFPSLEGHAEKLDQYYISIDAPYHHTVVKEGIKFHRPDDPDPDWIVKNCYLLLLAAVGEVKLGVWKKGPTGGRKEYPDFGRYVPCHYFKAWQAAAPLMWCDPKYWYDERRNMDWGVFTPLLQAFNNKRKELLRTCLLMLDESMSGWRPKTSKLGGLPNITFEPRKPIPLGTQL
jgi:hypothetical protein